MIVKVEFFIIEIVLKGDLVRLEIIVLFCKGFIYCLGIGKFV